MLIQLHNFFDWRWENFHNGRARHRHRQRTMFGELSMNPSNYVRSPAVHPLALGHPSQARHKLSNLALFSAKALRVAILGPVPGRRTQVDITIMDPANICFYLPILTHTAFVG